MKMLSCGTSRGILVRLVTDVIIGRTKMVCRVLLQVLLLATFLSYFGLPAVQKFLARGVMVVRSTREGEVAAPAITIMAGKQEPGAPWTAWKLGLEEACGGAGNSTLGQCIESNTYPVSDFLKMATLGAVEMKSIFKDVNEQFANSIDGKYCTFNVDTTIGPDYKKDEFIFVLSRSFVYVILVHDPKFFFGSYNPVFPIVRSYLEASNKTENFYHDLMLTEVLELDLPEDPCNTDPGYDFQACFKRSLSSQVGCRTRWDRCTLAGSSNKGATLWKNNFFQINHFWE